jgi:hypothetical protein
MRRNLVIALALASLTILVCGRMPSPAVPESAEIHAEDGPSPAASADAIRPPLPVSGDRLGPEDFHYLGAFRLPDAEGRPRTFEYGGAAMTFHPDGDASGSGDGFPGSLFISGHDRLPYGELPDGNQVAEVSIPAPVASQDLAALPQASFLQPFTDIARGAFTGLDELPRMAMLYLDAPQTGPKVQLAWGAHFQNDSSQASHAWFDPNLSVPDLQGEWFVGDYSLYSVNGYLLEIPTEWAALVGEMPIATGRFRDGGWSGMGPSLIAYRPWESGGMPPAPGTHLETQLLLLYASSEVTPDIHQALDGYQHPDEWEGAAWLTTADGRSAVLFAGTKSVGAKYWYGYPHPDGPDNVCVDPDFIGQFEVCRLADGRPCPETDLAPCPGHSDFRGWWSSAFEGQFILYDPADLARVAAGEMEPWEPQPYASISLDDVLLHNPAGVETAMIGEAPQRRYQIGEVGYDRADGLLYVLEWFADGAKPVVHVWKVE